MDPQDDNPPEQSEKASNADLKLPVDGVAESRGTWAEMRQSPAGGDGAELELPLVTSTFDPQTEPELPLDASEISRPVETEAATVPPVEIGGSTATADGTDPTTKATVETASSEVEAKPEDTTQATVDSAPKPALPMQKTGPSWAQTDPPTDDDDTAHEPPVPMQKPAPVWAQTVPAPAETAGDPEPTPPSSPEKSEPLTWPPRVKADAELPTQSDIWPPEPPTEPAMPAWPPKMIEEAEGRLPNLPTEPAPSEWDPPAVSPRATPESSSPPVMSPAASSVPAASTAPPASPTGPPTTATVPPAGKTPTASLSATAPPATPAQAPPSAAPPQPAQPPAGDPSGSDVPTAQPGAVTHSSALPSVGKKGKWQSWSSPPPKGAAGAEPAAVKDKPAAKDVPAPKEPPEPPKPAEPVWAPTLVIPPKSKEPTTDWPGVVDVPAWAPHLHIDTGPAPPPAPAPHSPVAEPPAAATPRRSSSEPSPRASAPKSQSPEPASPSSSSWAVVEQKRIDSQRISREVPSPEDRSYAEWFAWAKRGGAPVSACHAAAQAAFQALAGGKDVAVAAQMAAAAMVNPPLPVEPGRQTYCAWFSLANIDLTLDQPRAHAFATAALHALDAGADAKGAHAAGLDAAGIK